MVSQHCLISGRVQGVAFRYYTQQQALQLGITGWAHNLRDGRVSVLACGHADAVTTLMAWLQRGPSLADVSHCLCTSLEKTPPTKTKHFVTGTITLNEIEQILGIEL